MSIMELGALGEFLGVFALVATLIYLSIQVRQARNETANAVLEARTVGIRELHMGVATSDGLAAAMTKAMEAMETPPNPFHAALIARGLDHQEAQRVWRFFFSLWFHHMSQYQTTRGEQRRALDPGFLAVYANGLGRLFWDKFNPVARPEMIGSDTFTDHVNHLIEEADQELQLSMTNSQHTKRIASPLFFLKSAMVLKSGARRPVSHISSTLRCASLSRRRDDCTRFRYP